jgi:hypothetical protein
LNFRPFFFFSRFLRKDFLHSSHSQKNNDDFVCSGCLCRCHCRCR